MKRRLGILTAVIGVLVLAGIIGAYLVLSSGGGGGIAARISNLGADIRDYVAKQVVAIVNVHLEPKLGFDTIEYDAPGTIRLSNATLTAPDGTRIVDVSTLELTLAEVPERGKPIKIERVVVKGGSVNLVMDPETGGVKGLVPLIKRGGGAASTPADPDVPIEHTRLSNVFVLRKVEVSDLRVSIDDGSGAAPMVIEGFGASMDVSPGSEGTGEPAGPGWYAIDIQSGRSPGLEMKARGWFNIDTLTADVREGSARLWLDEQTVASLPPRLADLAREHDARGQVQAAFTGKGSVRDLAGADGRLEAKLTDFSVASGDRRLPIESVDATLTVAAGAANLEHFTARALGGVTDASGGADLTNTGAPGELRLTFEGLDLEKLMRQTAPEGEAPELAGIAHGRVNATFNLADPGGTVKGDGEVHVRDGVLITVPGLKQLAQVADIATFGQVKDRNHKADITFTLEPGRAVITKSEIVTNTLAARGTGSVNFDQTLDLKVNAGPLEKLQSLLGKVGDLLGKVTDQLVTYRVKGTLSEPDVSVQPLGVGG
ncbi:MAG: AsmA-like C-terminal region-containing protein [Phycisphaerales bacterium]